MRFFLLPNNGERREENVLKKKINFLKNLISFNFVDIFSVKRTFCRNQRMKYL